MKLYKIKAVRQIDKHEPRRASKANRCSPMH